MNERLGEFITRITGTMWAAYLFAALALVSLPGALASGSVLVIVGWVAQTFLQLVLLPIIMVGQQAQGRATEQKINETHQASLAEFALATTARASHAEELADLKAIAQSLHVHLTGATHPGIAPGSGVQG